MDFSLGEDRQALVDVVSRLARERYSIALRSRAAEAAPGHDPAFWKALAELGTIGALFPAEHGGFGGSAFDIMATFETLGHALVGEPVLAALMAGTVLTHVEGASLDDLIAGTQKLAVAFYEPGGRYDSAVAETTAQRDGEGWVLRGAKAVVVHAEAADALIVSAAAPDGLALFMVPTGTDGLALRGYTTNDGLRAAEVTLNGVKIPADARLQLRTSAKQALADAIGRGTLALCAEVVGIMEWLKEATLEYLRTRVQFGSPIGRNQVLQHRMAEVLIDIEQSRSAVINAAAAIDKGDVSGRAVSAAKYTIGVSGTRVAEEAIQMHGGIGMTQELDVSHYAKRAIMIDHQFGDSDHHLERYISLAAA